MSGKLIGNGQLCRKFRSVTIRPIMSGLAAMQGLFFNAGITTLMAGIIITSLPTIFLFFELQQNFIKGLQVSIKA